MLGDHTGGPTYLGWPIEGAARIDLDGQPAGTVTAAQAEFAAKKLSTVVVRMTKQHWERAKVPEFA